MISNRRAQRTVALSAGVTGVLVGRDAQGNGGREGVLNGARRARLSLANSIAEVLTVYVFSRATRDADPVVISALTLGSEDSLSITFNADDCAAHDLFAETTSGTGGDVVVDWTVMR